MHQFIPQELATLVDTLAYGAVNFPVGGTDINGLIERAEADIGVDKMPAVMNWLAYLPLFFQNARFQPNPKRHQSCCGAGRPPLH